MVARRTTTAVVAAGWLAVAAPQPAAAGPLENFVRDQLESMLTSGGIEAQIGDINGLFTTVVVEDVVLSDEQGVFMRIPRAEMDWKPGSLVRGKFRVEELRVENPQFLRAPITEPAAEEAPSGGGFDLGMLSRVSIEDIAVENLLIGEPVLGEEMRLSATGKLVPTEEGGVSADLTVSRLDGAGGQAQVQATLAAGEDLELDLQAAEPEGGILARLLDLPGLPPVQLALEGSGPAAQWSGELSAVAEGLAQVQGAVSLSYPADGRWSAETDLTATVTEQAPQQWRTFVRDELSLQLAANARGDAVAVESLTASTDAYALSGSNLSVGADGALTGDVTLTTDDADAFDALVDLPLASGTVAVQLAGTLNEPQATVDATLNRVATGQGVVDEVAARLQLAAQGPLADPAAPITLSGGATLTGLPEVVPGDTAELAVDATLNRETGALDIRFLQVETPQLVAEAEITANIEDMTAAGTISARADRIGPLAELAGLQVNGDGVLDVRLDRAGAGGEVDGSVRLGLSNLEWADPLYAEAVGERLTVTAGLNRTAEGEIRVADLAIDSAGVTGGGDVVVDAALENIDGNLALDVPDIAAVAPGVSGPVSLEATVGGPLASPDVTLAATSPGLNAAGTALDDLKVTLTADGLDADGTAGTLALSAVGPGGGPIRIRTPYEAGPNFHSIRLPQVDAEAAGLALGGSLTAATAPDLALNGRLTGRVTDWRALSAVAGTTLRGQDAAAEVTLEGQSAAATITADRLRLPDEGAEVSGVTLRADLGDLFGTPTINLSLTTGAGAAGGFDWAQAAVDVDGTVDQGTVEARLSGETDLLAEAAYDLPAQRVTLSTLRARNEEQDLAVALTQPAALSFAEGLSIEDLRLAVNRQGVVALDADLGPRRVDIDMRVEDMPLSLAQDVTAGPAVNGLLDARLAISGPPSNPTGTLTAAIPDLDIPDAEVRNLALRITGDLANQRLDVRMALDGVRAEELVGTASIPVVFSPQGIPSIPQAEPLSALMRWRGQVGEIWQLVPVVGHRVTGTGAGVIGVEGTLADPELTADVSITDGRYENLEYGTVITDLDISASRRPDGTVGLLLTGTDGGDGTIRLEGGAELTEEGDLVITGDGDLRSAFLIRRDDLEVAISGDLGFDGPLDGGSMTADLTVEYALFRLVNSFGGGYRTLEVIEVGEGYDPPEEEAEADEGGFNVALDVSVTAPNQLYVRGRGLDSEWSGAVRVTGTSSDPVVVGQMQVVRGRFDLVGNTFVFTEGTVDLTGGRSLDPTFDIAAANETDDGLTAVIRVRGTASDPKLELTSVPALPQDEVMARVLFGRSLADLGPVEALQAANAVRVLSGLGGGGPGLMDVVRDTLGVDTIRLGGGEDGPAVEIGKYITENVYVGVEQGTAIDSGGVNVEVELTPSITLEGRTTGRGSDIGVNWERDY